MKFLRKSIYNNINPQTTKANRGKSKFGENITKDQKTISDNYKNNNVIFEKISNES